MKYYTGIGARKTPSDIQYLMASTAFELASHKYCLRSGRAAGADNAFLEGVTRRIEAGIDEKAPSAEIYLPWRGFNRDVDLPKDWDIVGPFDKECMDIASSIHPAWGRCTQGVRKLHARNVYQILGLDLKTSSEFVLFWAEESYGKVKGGTATAVNLAREYDIPTINMYFDNWRDCLDEVLND